MSGHIDNADQFIDDALAILSTPEEIDWSLELLEYIRDEITKEKHGQAMDGYQYGNLDNMEDSINKALTIPSEDWTDEERNEISELLGNIKHEIKEFNSELAIPDQERAW